MVTFHPPSGFKPWLRQVVQSPTVSETAPAGDSHSLGAAGRPVTNCIRYISGWRCTLPGCGRSSSHCNCIRYSPGWRCTLPGCGRSSSHCNCIRYSPGWRCTLPGCGRSSSHQLYQIQLRLEMHTPWLWQVVQSPTVSDTTPAGDAPSLGAAGRPVTNCIRYSSGWRCTLPGSKD